MTIEKRLENLEKLVYSFIESQDIKDGNIGFDINGCRHTEDRLYEDIETNASDITDAEEAIAETYELVDTNTTDITDVQEAIAELYELIESEE